MLEVHAGISEAEFPVNLKEGLVLARSGHKVKLQPERFVSGIKNPDAIIDGAPADFKAPSSKTAINSAIKSVNKQLCKVAVLAIDSNMDKYTLAEGLREALGNQDKNKLVEKVIIRYTSDNTLVEFNRKEFSVRIFKQAKIKNSEACTSEQVGFSSTSTHCKYTNYSMNLPQLLEKNKRR
jgi:hypothetical protein